MLLARGSSQKEVLTSTNRHDYWLDKALAVRMEAAAMEETSVHREPRNQYLSCPWTHSEDSIFSNILGGVNI